MLSALIFAPLIFALFLVTAPNRIWWIQLISLIFSMGYFLFSLSLLFSFNGDTEKLQFIEQMEWISFLGVQYFVAIDGLSFWFVLLTAFLTPISVWASWDVIQKKVKGFYICLFLMVTAIMGTFLSLDAVVFYVFFESSLVPLYLIIGIWGGKERIQASIKFFIYTGLGSLFLLTGIVSLMYLTAQSTGKMSSNLLDFYQLVPAFSTSQVFNQQNILFFCFLIGFAIKLPVVPFHTWLPLAHGEAPASGSAWLAGVVLKMGAYGFFRFLFPLFPQSVESFSPVLSWVGGCSIVYGALMALSQTNIKKLVAYSSISHMGFILVGLFSLNIYGATGAFYQMLSHGLSSAGLFLLVGMIYKRTHMLDIADYGGLAKRMPILSIFFISISLSAIALPGTGGFVSEFFVLLGAFFAGHFGGMIMALLAVVLGAGYMLYLIHRVFYGETGKKIHKIDDLSRREVWLILPISLLIFGMGFFPSFFLKYSEKSLNHLIRSKNSYQLVPISHFQNMDKGNR